MRVPRCFFLLIFVMTFSVHFLNHTVLSGQHSHGQMPGQTHQEEAHHLVLNDAPHFSQGLLVDDVRHCGESSHNHGNFYLAAWSALGLYSATDALMASSFSAQAFLDAYFDSPSQQQAHAFYSYRWQARDLHRPQLASVILTI